MKLTPKITLILLAVALVPLGIFGTAALQLARTNLIRQAEAQLQFAAARKRQQLEFLLESHRERIRLVSSRTQLRISLNQLLKGNVSTQRERITRILSDVLPTIHGFETLAVTCPRGTVKASTDASDIGQDWSTEDYFIRGRERETGVFFRSGDQLKLRLAGPLHLDDQMIGVVVIRALAGDLESVLNLPIGECDSGETLLASRDPNGDARFINSPRFADIAPLTRVVSGKEHSAPMVQALMKVSTTIPAARDYRGMTVMAATEYIPEVDWGLVVKMDRAEALEPAQRLSMAFAGAMGGTAGLVLLIAFFTARGLTRPVLTLADSAVRIRSGEFRHRAPEREPGELGTLARAFNEMSDELTRLNASLEARVKERTAELELTNEKLRATDDQLRQFNRELEAAVRRRAGELAVSEERYQLVVQGAVDGIWDWNINTGECIYSDHWLEHLGFAPGEFPATWEAWIQRLHLADIEAVSTRLEEHFNDRAHFDVVCRVQAKDGDYRWFRVCGQAQWDRSGKPVRMAGSHTDVTDQKRAEFALQQTQKLEGLGVLAGGIAHDFNNILTAIVGNISLARIELPRGSEAGSLLGEVEKSALRAAELCKQMLAYSGQGKFQVMPLNVSEVVADMENLLRVSIAKNVILKLRLADPLPAITADVAQLRQIVMNLVINASEAIGDRSGIISLDTGLTRASAEYLAASHLSEGLSPGDYVFIEVSDTGQGMDHETMERIFDPFFTTKFTGRGLGLAALLGIVRSHNGTLRVYSEPGEGTTFKILLPCTESEAVAVKPPSQHEPFAGEGLVLIVDDEETVRATAARILERCGFMTMAAEDGRHGVAQLQDHANEVRLVLLDLTMPHMNGVEAFSQMKLLAPEVPVVLMSGYNEETALQRFAGRGLAGFVQKPFLFKTLVDAARAALEPSPGSVNKS